MIWICPWCNLRKRSLVDIKKHIHEDHESRDHHTYWLGSNDW